MNRITTKDGTSIFYKDWGTGPTVVFSHGWPLNADAWDAQMLFLGQQGYRVVAHDRRGHGRSEQTWTGNEYDTFADDLAELLEKLDLKDVTLVGHSMGGGEVARYIGRHGNRRVKKAVDYRRNSAGHVEERKEPWRLAHVGIRRNPRGACRGSFAVLQGRIDALLRL